MTIDCTTVDERGGRDNILYSDRFAAQHTLPFINDIYRRAAIDSDVSFNDPASIMNMSSLTEHHSKRLADDSPAIDHFTGAPIDQDTFLPVITFQ